MRTIPPGQAHPASAGEGGKRGRRLISAKTYVSILHAMLWVGSVAAGRRLARQKHRWALCVLHAKSSPTLVPWFTACNTPVFTVAYRAMQIAVHGCTQ